MAHPAGRRPPPTISILIPCFNEQEFVEASVQSALEQTYPVEEIICVDDGSTDDTLGILRDLEAAHSSITVVSQENRGLSGARNRGLELVSGDYVQFLDADDIMHPKKLEHQAHLIAESPFEPDFIAGAFKKKVLGEDVADQSEMVYPYEGDVWVAFVRVGLGLPSPNLWRMASVHAIGGFDEDYVNVSDADLVFRLLTNDGQVLLDSEPLTTVQKRSNSLAKENRARLQRSALRVLQRVKKYLSENGMLTPERRRELLADMFVRIQELYEYDPDDAIAKHEALIPNDFDPLAAGESEAWLFGEVYSRVAFRAAKQVAGDWYKLKHSLIGTPS